MKTRVFRRIDFSAGIQQATNWLDRQINELEDGRNIRFNEIIGAIVRRNGYIKASTNKFSASNKVPVGAHTAQFTTGAKKLVAVPSEDNMATVVKVMEDNGTYTTIINDLPANVDVYFCDFRDEVYVSGYTVADNQPFQPRNINKELNVSTTRNLLFAPWAKYYVVYRGVLYAANVLVEGFRHSDRFYKASAPTGPITFVRGQQINAQAPVTFVNQVPVMTSATAPWGVASHSNAQVGWDGWKVFNDANTRTAGSWFTNEGVASGWIRYDFGAGNQKVITSYMLRPIALDAAIPDRAGGPRSWYLEGSNDGTTFTVVHNVTNAAPWSNAEERTFTTTNAVAYRYYRINVYQNQFGNVTPAGINWFTMNRIKLYTTVESSRPYQLNLDSVRYIKPGMEIEIYRSGQSVKLYDITVGEVNKPSNTIQFLPTTMNITGVNTTTDALTIADASKFPTGTPILFTSSASLPAPLQPGLSYYAIAVNSTTIKVANSLDTATIGQAIDLTNTGTAGATHAVMPSYILNNNDEVYLKGRFGELTTFWNTDYPTADKADWSAVQPGTDSSNEITGIKESTNRLFVFTLNSGSKFDGSNTQTFSKVIGCASQRSIQNIDDDWLVWLTSRGRVYARNEASGQQEYISRGLWNNFFSRFTLDQLKNASAGITDGEYFIYPGLLNTIPHRAIYDFGTNTWSIDELNHPSLFYLNDSSSGEIKPYFVSNNGFMYQDDTGNNDDGERIRFFADLGRSDYGVEAKKYIDGYFTYSDNAVGTKVMVSIGGKPPEVIGEITQDSGRIAVKHGKDRESNSGAVIRTTLASAIDGPPQIIYAVHDFYNVEEELTGNGTTQR